MPIDSRIALGYQAPQIDSPVNMMMAAQKMQSGQQENQLRQFQMQQMQQEAERTNQLRQTLSGIDPTTPKGESDYGNALLRSGDVKGAQDYFASLATRRKSDTETALGQLAVNAKRAEIVGSEAGALAQHPALNFDMVRSWAATHAKDGFLTPEAMQNLDAMQNAQPDELRVALGRLQQQSVSAKDQLEQAAAAKRDAENKRHNAEQEALTKRGQNITAATAQRGQDLTATTAQRGQDITARGQDLSADPELQGRIAQARKEGEAAAAKAPGVTSPAAAREFLASAGYDPKTGEDDVSKLIPKSTGGLFGTAGAKIAEAFDVTTTGQAALGKLASRSSKLVLDLLGGKLGAGVSNADREFMLQAVGDIGNSMLSTGKRLAAWKDLRGRMETLAASPNSAAAAPTDHSGKTDAQILAELGVTK